MALTPTLRHTAPGVYRPGIDGLRALAVLAVMVYHLHPAALHGGFVGVDVFFVISGYVVTGSMMRDINLPWARFLTAFYARRFRRIAPALVVCLWVTVLASEAFIPDAWLSRSVRDTGLSAFFGWSNFVLASSEGGYFATSAQFNPFTHTWSLAVEEQFYLLFPLLVYLVLQGRLQPVRALWWVAGLSTVSLAWCAYATADMRSSAYYMLPSRFWELGAGALICLVGPDARRKVVERFGSSRLAAFGLALLVISAVFADAAAFPFPWAIPPVLGAGLLVLVAGEPGQPNGIVKFLGSRPLVTVGLLSYSLYLWHWPVYTILRWTVGLQTIGMYLVALMLTFGLAYLSYRFVEMATQRSPRWRQIPDARMVSIGLLAVIFGWGVALQVYERPWRFKQSVVEANRDDWYVGGRSPPVSSVQPCGIRYVVVSDALSQLTPTGCQPGYELPDLTLFVVGDSHANAYLRMLHTVVAQTGVKIAVHSRGGCSVAGYLRPDSTLGPACQRFQKEALAAIASAGRPGDIVFLASLRAERLIDQDGNPVPVRRPATLEDNVHGMAAAEAEASGVITKFTAAGFKVIVDLPKPVFRALPFRCSDWFNRMNPACALGFAMPRDDLRAMHQRVADAIGRAARADARMHVWDPMDTLCPSEWCNAFDRGRPLFFDSDHLSGHGNDRLAPAFIEFLNRVRATKA